MDINDQIAANLGLVYQQLIRFNLKDDQDAESYAYEALYHAILTYDKSAGAAFSTYAVCVIANELRKHLRTLNKKRQLDVVSYDEPTAQNDDSYTLIDTIKHGEDAEATVLFTELSGAASEAFKRVYATLPDNHKKVISMWYDSDYKIKQTEIAKVLQLSQPMVSRILSSFKYKLRQELEEYM